MPLGLQGGERLIARQTLSLLPPSVFPGSVLSLTRPDPTNTNTDTGLPTGSLSVSSISRTTGASSSAGGTDTSSSVSSLGRPTTSPPIPIPSSSSTPSASTESTSSSSVGSFTSTALTSHPISSVSTVMSSSAETSSSATSSPTAVVVAAAASHVKTGAVVGGVIGGVVFVLLIIVGLLLYLRVRRQMPSRSRRHSMGEFDSGGPAGRWAGLSSRDNTFEAVAVPPRSHQRSASRSNPQADSMGMIVAPTDSSAGHRKYSLSSSEEMAMPGEQKPRTGRRRSEYMETVPPLDYIPQAVITGSSPRRARKASNGSSTRAVALAKLNTAAASSSASTTATTLSGHSRQRSMDRAIYAGASNSNASTPTAVSHARGTPVSPTSPTSPYSAEPMSRSTSTNVGGVRRNPTRKPVPSYHSSVSAASTEKQSAPSTPVQGLTPAHSHEDLSGRRPIIPDLSHKSSFGDSRPVHYLVPDLPPSGRRK